MPQDSPDPPDIGLAWDEVGDSGERCMITNGKENLSPVVEAGKQ
jgi:hypothetical protein